MDWGGGAPHHPCIIFGETRERRVLTLHFHGHAASRDSLQLCLAILCIACAPSLQHPSLVSHPPPIEWAAGARSSLLCLAAGRAPG
jgi:hypothetical protein